MNEENFGQKILNAIKEKAIKPRPRWQFLLKNYVVWALGIIALIIGGLAVAVIIHTLLNNGWGIYHVLNHSLIGFIFITLPYFWLVFLGLFILAAHYNIKHTKTGYRLSLARLIVISVAASLLSGVLFYGLGFGWTIDAVMADRSPFYQSLNRHRDIIWQSPERGFLSGVVMEVISSENCKIIDRSRKIWNINIQPGALMRQAVLEPRIAVKMFGQKIDDFNFKAQKIEPDLPPPPMFFGRGLIRPPLPGINH